MNIAGLLENAARSFPNQPALCFGDTIYANYAGFRRSVAALGGSLRDLLKLAPGDRVALAMANRPEFAVAQWGAWYGGFCAVPMNAKLHPQEFAYILGDSGAKVCVVGPELEGAFQQVARELPKIEYIIVGDARWRALTKRDGGSLVTRAPVDPAWLFYTSGTTGRPKGATLTHRNLMAMTLGFFSDMDWIAPNDSTIHAAPMSHGSGLYGLAHVAKAAANVVPESQGFEADEIVDLLKHYRGATMFAAPTMIVRMINSPAAQGADFTNLKTIYYGGGPAYVADIERALDVFGPRLLQIYAQGECPMTISYLSKAQHMERDHPRYRERLGSTGIARTGVEIRIVDEDDNPMPNDEAGEVCVRSEVVMAGYWQNPDANAQALKGGWLHTGDVGSLDDDGFLTLKDRTKDMIISGGTNIYPREIEEVLLRHSAVLEAAVVGKPHPEWGEEVVAFIVARPNQKATEAELDRLCLDSIARFKRPRRYLVVESLPKNNYGKVLKRELRETLAQKQKR
ncbi:MAG: long-chain fatty acid--CoA ligase [Alphaproteobacteria bacterium]|nr:long-chain fatty acid--CoA ligase [Alphaproteobacteria bacterium]